MTVQNEKQSRDRFEGRRAKGEGRERENLARQQDSPATSYFCLLGKISGAALGRTTSTRGPSSAGRGFVPARSRRSPEGSVSPLDGHRQERKPRIYLEVAVLVDEDVGRLEIDLHDAGRVDVLEPPKNLVEQVLNKLLFERPTGEQAVKVGDEIAGGHQRETA
jgi:hypothetical protein